MYKTFFGLNRNPFEISPDPYFLFARRGTMRRWPRSCTGYCDTRDSSLCRARWERARPCWCAASWSFCAGKTSHPPMYSIPACRPLEFFRYIVGDLGIKTASQDKGSLLLELNNYLIARHRKNTTTVLIVDEAQHLEPELLEEIRLLTNLETSQQKLLQIVLVGQPELDQKMDSARPAATEAADRYALSTGTSPGRRNEELYPAALAAGGCKLACQHDLPDQNDGQCVSLF